MKSRSDSPPVSWAIDTWGLSVIAECFDRVEHCGPLGRVNAENNPDGDRDQKGDDRRPGANHDGYTRELGIERRDGHAHQDADQTAGRAYDCRLDQELLDDVASARSQRAA